MYSLEHFKLSTKLHKLRAIAVFRMKVNVENSLEG